MSSRADRRAGGRRAVRRVRGRGAGGRARVGARALRAAASRSRPLPDRRRRAPRHGLRDRPESASSPSTPAGCRRRRYELIEQLRERYPGLQLELLSPNADAPAAHGRAARPEPLLRQSVDHRLLCCNVRKVQPLTRHLAGLDAWITGLRRDQWASRTNIRKVEIDHDHGAIVKLNPLAEWTEDEVWDYVRERDVPYAPALRPGLHLDRLRARARARSRRARRRAPAAGGGRRTRRRSAASTAPIETRRLRARAARAARRGRRMSERRRACSGEAAEVALAEAQAVLAMVARRASGAARLADLIAAVDDGERRGRGRGGARASCSSSGCRPAGCAPIYGPEGEQAALGLYRRLPRGRGAGAVDARGDRGARRARGRAAREGLGARRRPGRVRRLDRRRRARAVRPPRPRAARALTTIGRRER